QPHLLAHALHFAIRRRPIRHAQDIPADAVVPDEEQIVHAGAVALQPGAQVTELSQAVAAIDAEYRCGHSLTNHGGSRAEFARHQVFFGVTVYVDEAWSDYQPGHVQPTFRSGCTQLANRRDPAIAQREVGA